jgi:dihydrofolate synthase/folylpolyglutamate synthase
MNPLYEHANHYLNEGLIRTETPEAPNPRTRREWMEWFLPRLGHPERRFEAIHVAGTSGKGSVAVMLAEILRAAGIRAGLHVSPYLQVCTEKLWIDGRHASPAELAELVAWIRPVCEASRGPHVPLHGMASVAVFLEHFARGQVELGVVEAGVGGRSDLTNVLRTRVAVITALGLDHVRTLGGDLASIAWHKAGIIKPGCRAVVLDGPAVPAAREEARRAAVPLRIVRPGDLGGLRGVELAMPGRFQLENASLALAALEALDDPRVTEEHVRTGLARARLPGRLELIPASPCPVLLDGAHNPDKLGAMLGALEGLTYRRLHVVYGALGSRTPDAQIERLAALAHRLVVTEPAVYQKTARPADEIARVARRVARGAGEHAEVAVERRALVALDEALAHASEEDLVLVTGSLYLCGEVRERWYPAAEVVERRSSWWEG